jgi:acylphosphatase
MEWRSATDGGGLSGSGALRTVRVRIEGRVQGVGYRCWTERAAAELALSGWVRNLRDGSVEAVFSGEHAKVGAMIERCRQGPRSAVVTSVSILRESAAPGQGFLVQPTL